MHFSPTWWCDAKYDFNRGKLPPHYRPLFLTVFLAFITVHIGVWLSWVGFADRIHKNMNNGWQLLFGDMVVENERHVYQVVVLRKSFGFSENLFYKNVKQF